MGATSAQKTRGELHLKDGTVKSGFAKIIGIESVKYKSKKKEKATFYKMMEMEKVVIHDFESSSTYVLRETDKGKFRLLKVLEEGRLNLYTLETQGYSGPRYTGGSNGVWTGGSYYSMKDLYVQKEGEIQVTYLGSNHFIAKNFRKASSEYFKDCPILMEKIDNKEYKKRDIRVIVNFYNENCDSTESK